MIDFRTEYAYIKNFGMVTLQLSWLGKNKWNKMFLATLKTSTYMSISSDYTDLNYWFVHCSHIKENYNNTCKSD